MLFFDHLCPQTFEGHTNSILRVEFLNKGMQLVTAAADGLVKLWSIKDEECLANLDNHEDKVRYPFHPSYTRQLGLISSSYHFEQVWALAISADEKTIVSAGADSVITFWQDCTELEEEEKLTAKTELVLKCVYCTYTDVTSLSRFHPVLD